MILSRIKQSSILDILIMFFFVLFLISLTNSIFVNQIGYYGTLILIIVKSSSLNKNQFKKIGLELPLILFIIAEIISTIFSINTSASFHNLAKRVLLLPIIYVVVAIITDEKKLKLFFNIFIISAVVTILFYILFAYNHFLDHLYQIESKGPSPFQYVMTAGGLISIAVVYLFSFIFNKTQKKSFRVFFLIGFLVSLIALLASYTRAAWLGAFSGIIIVLILRRKWIIIIPLFIIFISSLFLIKKESKVLTYKFYKGNIVAQNEINSNGRANDVIVKDNSTIIADYENGLLTLTNNKLEKILNTPAPVVSVEYWKDYFLIHLVDARMQIIKKKSNSSFEIKQEFTSIGDTKAIHIHNNYLFVADYDSGLTIYEDPNKLLVYSRFPSMTGIRSFVVNNDFLISYDKYNILSLYKKNIDGFVKKDSIKTKFEHIKLWYKNNFLFAQFGRILKQFKIEKNKFNLVKQYSNFGQIKFMKNRKEELLICNMEGVLFETEMINSFLVERNKYSVGFLPSGLATNDSLLILTYYKRNRISSIIDPYHPTNIQRIGQWKAGYKMWKDHFLFGVGDIDLHKLYSEYMEYYEKETYGHLHNNYVHLAVTLGSFGFLTVLFLFFKLLFIHFKILNKSSGNDFAKSLAIGTIAVFVAFLVSGLAEWNFGDHEIITMIWFSAGLNIASFRIMNKNN